MAYVTDAAREYAKTHKAKDDVDIDQRILDLEKARIIESLNEMTFPEFDKEDWYTLGPAQEDLDIFVTFSKDDEQYVKYILQKYGSMIEHVEGDVYMELQGPNDKIESEDGLLVLKKENVLRPIQKELAEKYRQKFVNEYGE